MMKLFIIFKYMDLHCSYFNECICTDVIDNIYECQLNDSNYFFEYCDLFVIRLLDTSLDITNINQVISNLHFVFDYNEIIIRQYISQNIILRESDGTYYRAGEYWFNCNIIRPPILTINSIKPKNSMTRIKLESKIPITILKRHFSI